MNFFKGFISKIKKNFFFGQGVGGGMVGGGGGGGGGGGLELVNFFYKESKSKK